MFLLASTKLFVLCTLAAAASAIPAASPSCATTQQEANVRKVPQDPTSVICILTIKQVRRLAQQQHPTRSINPSRIQRIGLEVIHHSGPATGKFVSATASAIFTSKVSSHRDPDARKHETYSGLSLSYAVTISLTQLVAGTPLITTNYENSNVTSFTLQDFYYGCAINLGQGFIGLPASCLISVTGK